MLRLRVHAIALAFGFVLVAVGGSARAQDAARNRAARLFDDAQERIAVGDFVAACSKLAESQRLDPQLGTLLHYGHCLEKQGKLASARAAFLSAATLAAERNAAGQVEPREEVARRRAARLEPFVSTLRIEASDPAWILECDGRRLSRDEWNRPIPIDPGLHSIEASAAGFQTWTHVVEIEGNAAQSVVSVPKLARLSETRAATPLQRSSQPPRDPLAFDASDAESGARQRVVAYALGGGSLAVLGVGLVFGLNASSALSAREDICPNASCALRFKDAEKVERLTDEARRHATRANVAFALGAGLAGAAVITFLTARVQRTSSPRVALTPGPGLTLRLSL